MVYIKMISGLPLMGMATYPNSSTFTTPSSIGIFTHSENYDQSKNWYTFDIVYLIPHQFKIEYIFTFECNLQ